MFKHDGEFVWRMKRLWIGAQEFTGVVAGISVGAGTTSFIEAAASGVAALDMSQDADAHAHLMPLPYDLDVEKHIYFRIMWGFGDTTSGDTVVWTLAYLTVNVGQPDIATTGGTVAGTTTLIAPATALDTTIDTASGLAQEYGTTTADRVNWSGYGSMDPKTLDPLNDAIALEVEATTLVGAPANVHFHGLEMSYTRRILEGNDGMKAPAKRHQTILGSALQPDKMVR